MDYSTSAFNDTLKRPAPVPPKPQEPEHLPDELIERFRKEQDLSTLELPTSTNDIINPEGTPDTTFNEDTVRSMLEQFRTGPRREVTKDNYLLLKESLQSNQELLKFIGSPEKLEYRKDVEFDVQPTADELAILLTENRYACMHNAISEVLSKRKDTEPSLFERFPVTFGTVPASYFTGRLGRSSTSGWLDRLKAKSIHSRAVINASTTTSVGELPTVFNHITAISKASRLRVSLSCEPKFFMKLGTRLVDSSSCYKPGSCNQQAPAYLMGCKNSFVVLLKQGYIKGAQVQYSVIGRAYGFLDDDGIHLSNFYPHSDALMRSAIRFHMVRGVCKMFNCKIPPLTRTNLSNMQNSSVRGVSGDGIYCNKDSAHLLLPSKPHAKIQFNYNPIKIDDVGKIVHRKKANDNSQLRCQCCGGRTTISDAYLLLREDSIVRSKSLDMYLFCSSCKRDHTSLSAQPYAATKPVKCAMPPGSGKSPQTFDILNSLEAEGASIGQVRIERPNDFSHFDPTFCVVAKRRRSITRYSFGYNCLLNAKKDGTLKDYVYSHISASVARRSDCVKLWPKLYGYYAYLHDKDPYHYSIELADRTLHICQRLLFVFLDSTYLGHHLVVKRLVERTYTSKLSYKEFAAIVDRQIDVAYRRRYLNERGHYPLVELYNRVKGTSKSYPAMSLDERKDFLDLVCDAIEYDRRNPLPLDKVNLRAGSHHFELTAKTLKPIRKSATRTGDKAYMPVLNIIEAEPAKTIGKTIDEVVDEWRDYVIPTGGSRDKIYALFEDSAFISFAEVPKSTPVLKGKGVSV